MWGDRESVGETVGRVWIEGGRMTEERGTSVGDGESVGETVGRVWMEGEE